MNTCKKIIKRVNFPVKLLKMVQSCFCPKTIALALLIMGCFTNKLSAQESVTLDLSELIRSNVEELKDPSQRILNEALSVNEGLHQYTLLRSFYESRNYAAAWVTGYTISEQIATLVQCIALSESNGLLPSDYHYDALTSLLEAANKADSGKLHITTLASLDLLLTDAYLLLSDHYLTGKLSPNTINENWFIYKEATGLVAYLEKAITQEDICYTLDLLLPVHKDYHDLRRVLRDYEKISWKEFPRDYNMIIQKGDTNELVPQLRRRLQITGDLAPGPIGSEYFDKDLEKAVMKFQRRHGLSYDGLIRDYTVRLLNVNVDERIKQIKANMERWRWMPDDFGFSHISINVPRFHLEMIENNTKIYEERVVVGREKFQTPLFSDSMEYIVLNPYWNMPKSIARDELGYKVREDSSYLTTKGITVFKGSKEINPTTVNWQTANFEDYFFRQSANEGNPMGLVKFMFPNDFDVYLHDTPSRDLFVYSRRTYSHGCIRLREPLNFAKHLLRTDAVWTGPRIDKALEIPEETKINLRNKIPIHILYWTVFIDEKTGELNFREDLYSWDEQVYEGIMTPLNKPTE